MSSRPRLKSLLYPSPARLLLAVMLALVAGVSFWGQSVGVERAKAAMEGSWRLEEWVVDGQPLRPPQIDGRLSERDGMILIMMSWSRPETRKFFYGYGTYSLTDSTWTYGYDRYLAFTDTGGVLSLAERAAAENATRAGFEGRRTCQMRIDGDKLVLEHDGGQRLLIYEGDSFSYVEHGQPLRR